ncbi:c-type cytochrome [Sediminibacterium sp.]|uniref:c-type cytochrome n=1 Tax=Sediminibacterium sp. TaxID=1917865 RepID=UPI003F6F6483
MKNTLIIASLTAALALTACSDVKRTPGTIYMPDMAYSRAYESYADHSNLAEKGINYTSLPVAGTISREEDMPFHIPMDKSGDTTNYTASKAVPNPYDSLSKTDMEEAERLYLINCGICHGTDLKGNGPIYNDGKGPYPAQPKNLIGDPVVSVMPAGQMFYSLAYGKNLMGSYASQLSRKQRWQVIAYIKAKQQASKAKAAPAPAADATATTK